MAGKNRTPVTPGPTTRATSTARGDHVSQYLEPGTPTRPRTTTCVCLLTLWLAVTGLGFCPGVASAATDSAATHDTATRVRQVRPGTGTVQAAVDVARPGDVLALHADTYSGRVFTPLGTERRTIVIRPFGNGGPTVRQSFTPADCSASRPNVNRILRFRDGVAW